MKLVLSTLDCTLVRKYLVYNQLSTGGKFVLDIELEIMMFSVKQKSNGTLPSEFLVLQFHSLRLLFISPITIVFLKQNVLPFRVLFLAVNKLELCTIWSFLKATQWQLP